MQFFGDKKMNELELLKLELELAELTAANLRIRIEIMKRNLDDSALLEDLEAELPEFLKEQAS
jgi:hypothetical protein